MRFGALTLVLLPVVTVACGGGSMGQQARSVPRDRNPVTVGPGRLVPIGGGRSLFIYCLGTGSPTVILEAGSAATLMTGVRFRAP